MRMSGCRENVVGAGAWVLPVGAAWPPSQDCSGDAATKVKRAIAVSCRVEQATLNAILAGLEESCGSTEAPPRSLQLQLIDHARLAALRRLAHRRPALHFRHLPVVACKRGLTRGTL